MSVVRKAAAFPLSIRAFASCVLDRESGGRLDARQSGSGARNPSSSASGRFQFLQSSWGQSLPYMVRDRLVRYGLSKAQGKKVRVYLQGRPIYQWNGLYQDIGFLEVIHRGGSHHWALAGSPCERWRP